MKLTPREVEILNALAAGETAKQQALREGRKVSTIRSLRSNVYRKLGVVNAPQAVAAAFRLRDRIK